MSNPVSIHQERENSNQAFGGNGGNGHDGRLRQVELDVREVKTEQRHLASKADLKEELHDMETRLNQALSDIKASLAALTEQTTTIKEHYATKWFILTSLSVVGGLIIAAVKLLSLDAQ